MAALIGRQGVRSGPNPSPNPVGSEALVSPFTEVDRILDCGMRPTASNGTPNPKFTTQYLIKWKGLSYLHCCWVPKKILKKVYDACPELKMKVDNFHRMRASVGDSFVAVRPEWTTVDRILASREGGDGKEYLVKYKDLTCNESYWESESDMSSFQSEIQKFEDDMNTVTRYWKGLVKEKHEVQQQAPQLNVLRKRKRGCDLRMPIPLIQGEGESLKVLGFSKKERKTFEIKLMRRGIGNFDWAEFLPIFKKKTYEEINNYGMLFLKHILEDRDDYSLTFSDGVPKGDTKSGRIRKLIAAMTLVKEKSKYLEENPRSRIFSNDRFYRKHYTLNDELDKLLILGVNRHGYQNWLTIIDDQEFGIEKLVSQILEVPFPYYGSAAAQQAQLSEIEYSVMSRQTLKVITYRDMRGIFSDFVRKRVNDLLVKVLTYEFAEKHQEKIRAVQGKTKPKLMNRLEASYVVIVKETLSRLSKTNLSSMVR